MSRGYFPSQNRHSEFTFRISALLAAARNEEPPWARVNRYSVDVLRVAVASVDANECEQRQKGDFCRSIRAACGLCIVAALKWASIAHRSTRYR